MAGGWVGVLLQRGRQAGRGGGVHRASWPGKDFLPQLSARPRADDQIVFEAPDEPEWIPEVAVSEDGRFVIISISRGTNPEARVEVFDLSEPGRGLVPLVSDFSSKAVVVTNVGSTFFLLTDDRAERQRIVAVDLGQPDRDAWREIVAEREALLLGARNCGGRLVCHHLQDACSRLSVFELDGTPVAGTALTARRLAGFQPWRARGAGAGGQQRGPLRASVLHRLRARFGRTTSKAARRSCSGRRLLRSTPTTW